MERLKNLKVKIQSRKGDVEKDVIEVLQTPSTIEAVQAAEPEDDVNSILFNHEIGLKLESDYNLKYVIPFNYEYTPLAFGQGGMELLSEGEIISELGILSGSTLTIRRARWAATSDTVGIWILQMSGGLNFTTLALSDLKDYDILAKILNSDEEIYNQNKETLSKIMSDIVVTSQRG